MQPISYSIAKVTAPIFKKYGHHHVKIINEWPNIVGSNLARQSIPKKIIYLKNQDNPKAVLYIDASNSSIALELSYMELIILEKINIYLGGKVIDKLKIIPNPVVFSVDEIEISPEKIVTKEQKTYIADLLKDIEDDQLKQALQELGQQIFSHNIL